MTGEWRSLATEPIHLPATTVLEVEPEPTWDELLNPHRGRHHAAADVTEQGGHLMDFIARSRKAVAGGVTTAAGIYAYVQPDGLSYPEMGAVAGAFLVGAFLVWITPNAEPTA